MFLYFLGQKKIPEVHLFDLAVTAAIPLNILFIFKTIITKKKFLIFFFRNIPLDI